MTACITITPAIDLSDPRMRRALDGWLGLYEACYMIGNPCAKESWPQKRRRSMANRNIDRDLLLAWMKKFKLEARLAEIERIVKENPGRRG